MQLDYNRSVSMTRMSYKKWVLVAISLFVIGLIVGFVAPASSVISEDITALEEFGSMLTSQPPIVAAILIFARNASVLVFSFLLSPILCLLPIAVLTVNGWVIAFVAALVAEITSVGFVLAALLPHGIVEIPALILGEAAALSFGSIVITGIFNKQKRGLIIPNLKHNLRYLAISLALLLPAAFIETFVTPLFAA